MLSLTFFRILPKIQRKSLLCRQVSSFVLFKKWVGLFLTILVFLLSGIKYTYCQQLHPCRDSIRLQKAIEEENVAIPLNIDLTGFFCEPLALEEKNFYTGISEPGLDTVTAANQALIRALGLASLRNASCKGMSDYFQKEAIKNIDSKYEELYQLTSSMQLPSEALHIYNPVFLENGEAILRIGIDSTGISAPKRILVNVSTDLYHLETILNDKPQTIFKTVMCINTNDTKDNISHSEKFSFTFANGRWVGLKSNFDGKDIIPGNYRYFYKNQDSNVCNDTSGLTSGGWSTLDGLWHPYISSAFWQLSLQLKGDYTNIKRVGDTYQQKNIELNRESGIHTFHFFVERIFFLQNKLYTKIRVNSP